ncbi:MAG: hypothetical protein WC627_10015 [Legionella sp.]|jgi:hypothetical protein
MINDKVIEVFFELVAKRAKDKQDPLNSAANLLMQRYIKYLYDLESNNAVESVSNLIGEISLFKDQPEFSAQDLTAIIQDISNNGAEHRAMINTDRDIIERLYVIEKSNYSMQHQKIPTSLRTGIKDVTQQVMPNRNVFFVRILPIDSFYSTDQTYQTDKSELGIFSQDREFLALPQETQELMLKHDKNCDNLIKYHGLTYSDLQKVKLSTLSMLLSSSKKLYILTAKHVTIKELLDLDEKKLELILNNFGGLLAFINLKLSFNQIVSVDFAKMELLIKAPKRVSKLITSNIPFTQIAELSSDDLKVVLTDKPSPKSIAIENKLKLKADTEAEAYSRSQLG